MPAAGRKPVPVCWTALHVLTWLSLHSSILKIALYLQMKPLRATKQRRAVVVPGSELRRVTGPVMNPSSGTRGGWTECPGAPQ